MYTILKFIILFSASVFLCLSCEKAFMTPNPDTDNLAIFNEYHTLVKEKYAMLDFKGVDIDQLGDSIRTTITDDLTRKELFEKLAIITNRLRDGHSLLYSIDFNDFSIEPLFTEFALTEGYPLAFDSTILFQNYLDKSINPSIEQLLNEEGAESFYPRALYGTLPQNTDIGYIWIPSWDISISDEEFDTMFKSIADTKGLIVDMRFNGGGDPSLATKFASYFTEVAIEVGYENVKTGPASGDFVPSYFTMEPTSSVHKYLKPVAVLTDRNSYSATTTFNYCVDPIPTVFTLGQRSGGGSGSFVDGFLANGWTWQLSVTEFIDAQGRNLDDGVDPDIPVELDINDTSKDEIIERAILELQ